MSKLLTSEIVLMLVLALALPVFGQEEWVPYVPPESHVTLVYWRQNGESYIDVSIEFWDSGYNVTDWGTLIFEGGQISVSADIWKKIGLTLPYVWIDCHTYALGNLSAESYLFIFESWGVTVKETVFDIGVMTVPDNFSTIQEAINNAIEGCTIFIRNGTYIENVVVNKTVSLLGENRYAAVIDGNNTGYSVTVEASNVVISGLKITGGYWYDIAVTGVNSTITDCFITENGVYVTSSQNKIVFNLIDQGFEPAICLYYSHNNTIVGNTISNQSPSTRSSSTFMALYSNYSRIYHNNFVNDNWYWSVTTYLGSYNWWDNGCEGNYWDGTTGNDTDGDGVFETFFNYDIHTDWFPLVNPYWNPSDVNHDLGVNLLDVVTIAGAYGSTPSSLYWNPHADIVKPYGKIDILDLVTCCTNYGRQFTGFPQPPPPPPNGTETTIEIYAFDPNDTILRTWDLVFDRPMPPLGEGGAHWGADIIEPHNSGDTMTVQWYLAPGDHYLILGITQTGGPEYGVYNGTVTINGNSYEFSGLSGDQTTTIEFTI